MKTDTRVAIGGFLLFGGFIPAALYVPLHLHAQGPVPVALPVTMGLVALARLLVVTHLVPWALWRLARGSRWSVLRGLIPAIAVFVTAFLTWVWSRELQWGLAIAASPRNHLGNVINAPALAALRMDDALHVYVCAIALLMWSRLTREEASRGRAARVQWFFLVAMATLLLVAGLAMWFQSVPAALE